MGTEARTLNNMGTDRMVLVRDDDLGTIAAVIDAEGIVLSTAADMLFERVNMRPHMAAIDLASRELADLYARRFPDHDAWLKRMWDEYLTEGDA